MKKIKYILNFISICLCVGIIFVGAGYLYLNRELGEVENKVPSVPYYQSAPDNKGVMFDISGERCLFYMDFERRQLTVIYDDNNTPLGGYLYGYTVDYEIEGDYDLLAGIIDILGGLELENEEGILRYTGVQVTDILMHTADNENFIRDIVSEILHKVSKNGFGNEDFLYIIENSKTNLTVPDCYYWRDYISEICSNVQIAN